MKSSVFLKTGGGNYLSKIYNKLNSIGGASETPIYSDLSLLNVSNSHLYSNYTYHYGQVTDPTGQYGSYNALYKITAEVGFLYTLPKRSFIDTNHNIINIDKFIIWANNINSSGDTRTLEINYSGYNNGSRVAPEYFIYPNASGYYTSLRGWSSSNDNNHSNLTSTDISEFNTYEINKFMIGTESLTFTTDISGRTVPKVLDGYGAKLDDMKKKVNDVISGIRSKHTTLYLKAWDDGCNLIANDHQDLYYNGLKIFKNGNFASESEINDRS